MLAIYRGSYGHSAAPEGGSPRGRADARTQAMAAPACTVRVHGPRCRAGSGRLSQSSSRARLIGLAQSSRQSLAASHDRPSSRSYAPRPSCLRATRTAQGRVARVDPYASTSRCVGFGKLHRHAGLSERLTLPHRGTPCEHRGVFVGAGPCGPERWRAGRRRRQRAWTGATVTSRQVIARVDS